MTIPLHKDDHLRLTPYRDAGDLTTYIIKPASMFERQKFEAELASPPYNAGVFYDWHVNEAIDDFIETSTDGDLRLGARDAAIAVRNGDADADQKFIYDAVVEKASLYSKPYQELLARRARRQTYLPYIATKMFLIGWENREHKFEAEYGRVADRALNTLTQNDVTIIGLTAFRFMTMDDVEKSVHLGTVVLRRPADFLGGRKSLYGGGWTIGEDEYAENPKFDVSDNVNAVIELHLRCHDEGVLRHLPGPGGMADQPAKLLSAFEHISRYLAADDA